MDTDTGDEKSTGEVPNYTTFNQFNQITLFVRSYIDTS